MVTLFLMVFCFPSSQVLPPFPLTLRSLSGDYDSYRVTDAVSVYYNHSEGIFPNTGQRDGSYRPIEAEQTENNEIGVKFDFWEGKLSGTLGVFRIKRENAVWNWKFAPNPAAFTNGPADQLGDNGFNPDLVRSGAQPIRYGVAMPFVEQAFANAGMEIPVGRRGDPSAQMLQAQFPGQFVAVSQQPTGNPLDPNEETYYFFVNYDAIKADPNSPFKEALDSAVSAEDYSGWPIRYFGGVDFSYSASRASVAPGANVLFEEEGVGFDGSLILSPFSDDRYQLIFGFSHQKREVVGGGFQLAPGFQVDSAGSPTSDEQFTTEYDIWVYLLGPENFEDPADPTTLKGNAVNGVDLSFVPRWNLVLWNKYAFREGWMEGVSIGGGVRWTSSIPTTAGVGGDRILTNRYPTPDVPDRYVVDLSVGYNTQWKGYDLRFALKVNNLLNDEESVAIATYTDEAGNSIQRRTRQLHYPRSLRLSVSIGF
jgi:iron complex outermembrane recepter protein